MRYKCNVSKMLDGSFFIFSKACMLYILSAHVYNEYLWCLFVHLQKHWNQFRPIGVPFSSMLPLDRNLMLVIRFEMLF